jgi:hypothetical protein
MLQEPADPLDWHIVAVADPKRLFKAAAEPPAP